MIWSSWSDFWNMGAGTGRDEGSVLDFPGLGVFLGDFPSLEGCAVHQGDESIIGISGACEGGGEQQGGNGEEAGA